MSYRIIDVEQNTEQWYIERRGKITGSVFKNIIGPRGYLKEDIVRALHAQGNEFNPKDKIENLVPLLSEESRYLLYKNSEKKVGYWRIVAERLFRPLTEEEKNRDARERGHELEHNAIERFEIEYGKKTKSVGLVVSEENTGMSVSPDAIVVDDVDKDIDVITEAVETKNYEDANHAEAVVTKQVPHDLWPQIYQYFIVIDTLEKLHLVFNTDRTYNEKLQYCRLTITRDMVKDEVEYYKDYEKMVLRSIDEIVEEFAF